MRWAPKPCGSSDASQFLFISDLTDKATGSTLAILIVLYVGSQLLSTILMSTATDRTQRMIFLALPFVFVIFVINFPAGLLVYWITTNLWTVGQGYLIRKKLGPIVPIKAAGDKDDDGPPAGGLFARLQSAAAGPKAAAAEPATAPGKPGSSAPPPRPPRKKK